MSYKQTYDWSHVKDEDEAAARDLFEIWHLGSSFLFSNEDKLRALARFHASARSQGREAGLEEAARYMESRNVTASEFYARSIRALKSPSTEEAKP